MALINISHLNPVKFTRKNYTLPAGINNYALDDVPFATRIKAYEEAVEYYQIWQKTDTIKLQFLSQIQPLDFKVVDCSGNVRGTVAAIEVTTIDVWSVMQVEIPLAGYDEGIYSLQVPTANYTFESEPFSLKTLHEDSMLIEYKNSYNREGMIFVTDLNPELFKPNIRVQGGLKEDTPGSSDKTFIDQPYNSSMLSSATFDTHNLIIGDAGGTPYWMAKKIMKILGNDYVKVDTVKISKPEGAKLDKNTVDGYPMAGWKIDVREAENKDSLSFEDTGAAAGSTSINVKWAWMPDNPYDDLLNVGDSIVYQGNADISPGAPIIADFHLAPPNQYFVVRYPIAEASKIIWFESQFNNGQIPDSVFRALNRLLYKYIIARVPATFGSGANDRVTFS